MIQLTRRVLHLDSDSSPDSHSEEDEGVILVPLDDLNLSLSSVRQFLATVIK